MGSCGRVGRQCSGQSPSQLSDPEQNGLALVLVLRRERAEFSWLGLGGGSVLKSFARGPLYKEAPGETLAICQSWMVVVNWWEQLRWPKPGRKAWDTPEWPVLPVTNRLPIALYFPGLGRSVPSRPLPSDKTLQVRDWVSVKLAHMLAANLIRAEMCSQAWLSVISLLLHGMATELMNVVVLKPVNTNDQTILKDRIDTSLLVSFWKIYGIELNCLVNRFVKDWISMTSVLNYSTCYCLLRKEHKF